MANNILKYKEYEIGKSIQEIIVTKLLKKYFLYQKKKTVR